MNPRWLDYLCRVLEHGSFDAAARAAGVSQPAISHGLRALQQALGQPLFERQGRRRIPTPAAWRLALQARPWLDQGRGLGWAPGEPLAPDPAPEPSQPPTTTTLHVGLTASAALVCGPALQAAWCGARRGRHLALVSADEGRMLGLLQARALDLVIAPRPRGPVAPGLQAEPLYAITPRAWCRRSHPLAATRHLADLRHADWAVVGPSIAGPVDVLGEAFRVRGLGRPRVAVSCPDYASLVHLLTQADLLAVLPHPALLGPGGAGQAWGHRSARATTDLRPLALVEAWPRYEMALFCRREDSRRWGAVRQALRHLQGEGDGDGEAYGDIGRDRGHEAGH